MRSLLFAALLFVTVSGCRSYGQYGTQEARYQAIVNVNQAFEAQLVRHRAELDAFSAAFPEHAEDAASVRAVWEEAFEFGKMREGMLSATTDYRTLHHAHGAIITRYQVARDRFAHLAALAQETGGELHGTATGIAKSQYKAIPPQYQRAENQRAAVTLPSAPAQEEPVAEQ